MGLDVGEDCAESVALIIIGGIGAAYEVQPHLPVLEQNALDAEAAGQPAQGDDAHKFLAFGRNRAEPVFQPVAKIGKFLVRVQIVQLAVEKHALAASGDVALREKQLQVAVHRALVHEIRAAAFFRMVRRIQVGELVGFQLVHGLRENLLVSFVTHVGNEAALLRAQEVSGSADVEVLQGYVESAAQVAEFFQCLQPPPAFVGQLGEGRRQQIAEGLAVAPPYAPAELVQVAEPEVLRLVDNDGVHVGNVDAVFYNGGGQEDIEVVVYEIEDDLFQHFGLHLPVGYADAGVGHEAAEACGQLFHVADAVVYEEYLAAAAHFEADGVGYERVVERMYLGLYRIAVGRRRIDDREVAGSHEGKLERAGDGRGAQRECVHIDTQLAEFLLHADAELLLLVDDEQPQVLEMHARSDEGVRAYEDLYLPCGQVLEQEVGLACGAPAAQVVHPAGEVLQPLAESLVVLEGKHRGGHQYGHLLPVGRCLEGGAYRYFRLSEAYVAADETVHGSGAFHVVFYGLRGLELVGSVFVDERSLQFVLQEAVGAEGKSPAFLALGVEADEVAGYVFYLFLRPLLHFLPCAGSQLADVGRLALAPFEFGELVERMDGDEYYVVALINQLDGLLRGPSGHGQAYQTGKAAYAVVYVCHVVAYAERLYFLQGQGGFARAGLVAAQGVFVEAVEELVVGEEAFLQCLVVKSFVQRISQRFERQGVAFVFKNVTDALGLFRTVGAYIYNVALVQERVEGLAGQVEVLVEKGLGMAVERQLGPDVGRGTGAELVAREPLQGCGPYRLGHQDFPHAAPGFRFFPLGGFREGGLRGKGFLHEFAYLPAERLAVLHADYRIGRQKEYGRYGDSRCVFHTGFHS